MQRKKILGIRLAALIEIAVFVVFILFLSSVFDDGNRFLGVYPHPFWAIVLLVTVQYGTFEGMVATLFCTIVLYLDNLPEQSVFETVFDYRIRLATTPFFWFLASYILGELRGRIANQRDDFQRKCIQAKERSEKIAKAYEELKQSKENLEAHIVSQQRTFIAIYSVFKDLELINVGRIFIDIENVVRVALNPKKYSIFALGPNGFEAVTSVGWEKNENYSSRFNFDTEIYQEVVRNKQVLCAINPEHQKILKEEGVILGPLIDKNEGKVFGMLKIEDISLDDFVFSATEEFKVLCDWIGSVYTNAQTYNINQEYAIFAKKNRLFSGRLLKIMKEIYLDFAKRQNLSLIQIEVKIPTKSQNFPSLLRALQKSFPEGSQFFENLSRKLTILVMDTSKEEIFILTETILKEWEKEYSEGKKIYLGVQELNSSQNLTKVS